MSSASSARPARSPCRPPASTATRSSTASWTTRSEWPPCPPVSPSHPAPTARKAPVPCRKRGGSGGSASPCSSPLPLPRVSQEASAFTVLRGKLCFSPAASLPPPVLPFLEVFHCARVVPWEFRSLLSEACETPGSPGAAEGRDQGFSRFLWLYFPTERLQEKRYILPDPVLDGAIFLISPQAGQCYCSPRSDGETEALVRDQGRPR